MNALSQSSEYALRALTYLAQQRGDGYCLVREIAEKLDIPPAFLVKIVQPLVARGILNSRRGRGGGYRLAKPASQVTLFEIVDAIDYVSKEAVCVLGQATCSDERACPMHAYWKEAYTAFRRYLADTTLDDIVLFCKTRSDCAYPA